MQKFEVFWRRFVLWQKLIAPFVWIGLGLSRLAVLTLPFRLYAPVLGKPALGLHASVETHDAARLKAKRVSEVIRTVAKYTPWTSNCLAQALTASVMLRCLRIPSTAHFGLTKDTDDAKLLEAHAWVMSGSQPVTGYRESVGMTLVKTFIRDTRQALV